MKKKFTLLSVLFFVGMTMAMAQDAAAGAAGISSAIGDVQDYFEPVKLLSYAIGGIVGLIGGIRIFNKWNSGDQDINKELVSYGGAMLFLVIAPNIIGAFFGL